MKKLSKLRMIIMGKPKTMIRVGMIKNYSNMKDFKAIFEEFEKSQIDTNKVYGGMDGVSTSTGDTMCRPPSGDGEIADDCDSDPSKPIVLPPPIASL